jgi:hypothetical protein
MNAQRRNGAGAQISCSGARSQRQISLYFLHRSRATDERNEYSTKRWRDVLSKPTAP